MRALNRKIVSRIFRRATMGIPLIGLYFGIRIFKKDFFQGLNSGNSRNLRMGYLAVASIEAVDVMAQMGMVTGLSLSAVFPGLIEAIDGVDFPELMKLADRASIAAAVTSCTAGTYLETVRELANMTKDKV